MLKKRGYGRKIKERRNLLTTDENEGIEEEQINKITRKEWSEYRSKL